VQDWDTTISVIVGAIALAAAAVLAFYVMMERARTLRYVTRRAGRRGREHELHWTAIRFRNQGLLGEDLQEAVCQWANCSPTDANIAILRVGADI
jgi:hypothetical protein